MDVAETLWNSAVTLTESLIASLPKLAGALVVIGIFLVIAALVQRIVRGVSQHLGASLQLLFGRLAYILTLLVGVVLALGFFGLGIGDMLASLGVAGVVIGFAFKDLLENFVAGVLLLWRQPFVVGDRISGAGKVGVVREINFRSTVLVTDSGSFAYVPNAKLFTDVVENFTPDANTARKHAAAEGQQRVDPGSRQLPTT